MEGIGDLIIFLSTLAAIAAAWFQWSANRAGKRALALIRADAPAREPGVALEVLGTKTDEMVGVEIRLTNRAGTGNIITGLYLETTNPPKKFAAQPREGGWTVPLVIAPHDTITGHLFFRVGSDRWSGGAIVVVDIDERVAKRPVRG